MLNRGFTLIELMVSVSIFATVAVIATGAVLTANNINKQAQAIKQTMDNLNFALDSMVLKLKKGGGYYCNSPISDPPVYPTSPSSSDCPGGGTSLAFKLADTDSSNSRSVFMYRLSGGSLQEARGQESDTGAITMSGFTSLTSSAITINDLKFFVLGNCEGGNPCDATASQPRVLISISGVATAGKQTSTFAVQTTVSDRR